MNRINYTGAIYNIGTSICGFDFGGRNRRGVIVEYYAPGGWYAVRTNLYGDTVVIRVETAKRIG
jgi:hypothetical protein